MGIERRLYPRILVTWPVTLQNVQGSIEGKTKDISVDGVFIFCSKKPEFGETFPILLKPSEERSILVVGKRVWSDIFHMDNRSIFGMGVQFMLISPEDQQYIASLVEKEKNE